MQLCSYFSGDDADSENPAMVNLAISRRVKKMKALQAAQWKREDCGAMNGKMPQHAGKIVFCLWLACDFDYYNNWI